MAINKVMLTGNLTKDAELRSTQGGMSVMNFSVAVNERTKNSQTGEWEDRPGFFDCTMFGKRAEAIHRYMAKGAKLAIDGKLRYRKWQDKDGSNRSKVEIVVDEIELMSAREKAEERPQQAVQTGMYDEDIPF